MLESGKKLILFQGDSVTDCAWRREVPYVLGWGYATMVKGWLGCEYPEKYECLNRGISGNRVVDLYARMKVDILNLKPDYLSMLIGINDAWHEYAQKNGVDADKYEMVYNLLIKEVKQELPETKIMILEPFVLPGRDTVTDVENPGRWEFFAREVPLRRAAARRVAEANGLPFVELQKVFDEHFAKYPNERWINDGVHPSAMGHELIKREWVKMFEKIK